MIFIIKIFSISKLNLEELSERQDTRNEKLDQEYRNSK